MKHLSQYTQDEWEKEVQMAEEIWDNIPEWRKDASFEYQTKKCPMHFSMFYQLSSVSGFNLRNGWTYQEYTDQFFRELN